MDKVRLDKIIERYNEIDGDLDDVSVINFLDVSDEEFTQASNKVGEKLKECHNPKRHGENVKEWSSNGPFGAEVFEFFGFNKDIFEDYTTEFVKRDSEFIKEKIGFDQPGSAKDLLAKSVNVLKNLGLNYEDIREKIPRDRTVWTCLVLKDHGLEEVELWRWTAADYLFKKNVEHQAQELMGVGINGLGNMLS